MTDIQNLKVQQNLSIPIRTKLLLAELADKTGKPLSRIFEEAIDEYAKKRRTKK